jgi:hypothetical protein
MQEGAYATSVIAGTFYLIASLRLLRLSRKTGERPERLLGLYFGLSGVYYFGYNLPTLFGFGPWSSAIDWVIEWIYTLGVFPFLLFIRTVFRAEEAWAGVLAGICCALLVVGTGMGAIEGQVAFSLGNPWFMVQWAGYTAPCAWLCWEALLCRRGARKRVRIGICEPAIANRYLLMALFGGFQVLACLSDVSFAYDVSGSRTVSLISDALLGGTEIASVAVLWLAFFPPPVYTDWITRRAVISPAPIDG